MSVIRIEKVGRVYRLKDSKGGLIRHPNTHTIVDGGGHKHLKDALSQREHILNNKEKK